MKLDEIQPLDAYLEAADGTSEVLRGREDPLVHLIRESHELIGTVLQAQVGAKGGVADFLALNAMLLFDAGARVALSGHAAAIHPILRTALESACYSFLMKQEDRLEAIWLQRHRSDDHLRRCRHELGQAPSKVFKNLEALDVGSGAWLDEMYQASIDFGAHPNSKSVLLHMSMRDHEQGAVVSLAGMYDADGFETRRALLATAEYGFGIAAIILASAPVDDTHDLERLMEEFHAKKQAIVQEQFNQPTEGAR